MVRVVKGYGSWCVVPMGRGWLAVLAGLLPCLSAAHAQTWTPTSRTGQSYVIAGPLGPTLQQISHSYSDLTATHDLISASVPATWVPDASCSAQLDAVPYPTGMFLAVAGSGIRGPIPCPSGCAGSAYANADQSDQWTFTLSQATCYELRASITLSNDSGLTSNQGFQFLYGSSVVAAGFLSSTGSQQFSRSGTLPPGTYTITIDGYAEGNGAPRSASYSHWVSITLGPPTVLTQPASVTACRTGTADLSAGSGATGASYQWQMETSPNNWINANNGGLPYNGGTIIASGATTGQMHLSLNTLPGAPSVRFRCVVTNTCGSATSNPATLTMISCTCNPDFNGDGDVGTDADIEAFFACLAGNCCATCGSADFNGDGDVGTDADIESFFRVLAGGSC